MTTENQARESIYQEFITQWANQTDVTFENESFTPDGNYVRVTVRGLPSNQRTMGGTGNRRFRRNALVFVQIFTPVGEGRRVSGDLTELAKDVFEGRTFDGLSFSSVNSRGVGPDGKWYQALVEAPFDYEETK